MTKSDGVRLRNTIYCDMKTMIFLRLRMCSTEGALIESGKTKTSNHFTIFEHNHLRLRFTVLSLATKTCFCISCKYLLCTISRILNSSVTNHFIPCWNSFSFARNLPERYSVRLIVKSFNYFLYKICLSYFVISALKVSAYNLWVRFAHLESFH